MLLYMDAAADYAESRGIKVSFVRDLADGWRALFVLPGGVTANLKPFARHKAETPSAYERRVRSELTKECARALKASIAEYTGAGEAMVGRGVRPMQSCD